MQAESRITRRASGLGFCLGMGCSFLAGCKQTKLFVCPQGDRSAADLKSFSPKSAHAARVPSQRDLKLRWLKSLWIHNRSQP